MFIENLFTDFQYFFFWVTIVVFSTCLHELFHALAASWQGDDTAKDLGYFTMNPLVHMGLPSLLILFLMGLCWGACPVNPSRFKHRYSDAIVAFAGPFANLLLVFVSLFLLGRVEAGGLGFLPPHAQVNMEKFLHLAALCNAALFILNMIPLPPLDGSTVMARLVPAVRGFYEQIQGGGFVMLFLLFYLPFGFGSWFWGTAANLTKECYDILSVLG